MNEQEEIAHIAHIALYDACRGITGTIEFLLNIPFANIAFQFIDSGEYDSIYLSEFLWQTGLESLDEVRY